MSFDPTGPMKPEPFSPAPPDPLTFPTQPVVAQPVGPAIVAAPPKRRSSGGILNVILIVAAAVAIGGVAFAVGRGTAPASATAAGNGRTNNGAFAGRSFAPGASGAPGFNRGGFGGGFGGAGLTISGTVESVDGDTMTIKTASGQTIQVSTGSSTTYHSQTDASASDVQAGKTVEVQVDFAGGAGGGGGGGRANPSGAPSGPVGTAGSVTIVP